MWKMFGKRGKRTASAIIFLPYSTVVGLLDNSAEAQLLEAFTAVVASCWSLVLHAS